MGTHLTIRVGIGKSLSWAELADHANRYVVTGTVTMLKNAVEMHVAWGVSATVEGKKRQSMSESENVQCHAGWIAHVTWALHTGF